MRRLPLVLAVLLVAGCASPAPSGDGPMDSSGPTPTQPPGDEPGNGDVPLAAPSANGCSGFYTFHSWPWDTGPGAAPPGWEQDLAPDGPAYGSEGDILALRCERVSWGTFERPMDLLFDYHSKASTPVPCRSDTVRSRILHALWTTDAEFGAFLSSTYRMPVHVAETIVEQEPGPPSTLTWSWGEPGATRSSLTVQSLDLGSFSVSLNEQLFWDNGQGITRLEWLGSTEIAGDQPAVSGPGQVVQGSLKAPMLHAERIEPYQATGVTILASDFKGELQEFSDYRCEAPKPSP